MGLAGLAIVTAGQNNHDGLVLRLNISCQEWSSFLSSLSSYTSELDGARQGLSWDIGTTCFLYVS